MKIIPAVNGNCVIKKGSLRLPKKLNVSITEEEKETVLLFASRVRKIEGFHNFEAVFKEGGALVCERLDSLPEEGYRLTITPEGIKIVSSGHKGLNYALVTLFQLLVEGKGSVECCELEDNPLYSYRGIMLDCCRHFFPIEEVQKIIEQCALLKLNIFHWHLSEDQGFRIESEKYPKLNTVGSVRKETMGDGVEHKGYYTKEQLRETVVYARERGISVIPELDMPGHTTAIVASYPELGCTGEPVEVGTTPGIYTSILCPGKDKTLAFVRNLLDELCEIFDSPYFHLGGDEAAKKNWADCPDCKARMEQYGLKNPEELQSWFMNQMIEYLRMKGRTVITWNDALASGMLKEGTAVQYWAEMGFRKGYTHHYINSHKFILSNYGSFYCDQIYAQIPLRKTYGYLPRIKSAEPLSDNHILGIEAPLWTEFVKDGMKLEQMFFPRLLAVSERCWNREYQYSRFIKRVRAYEEVLSLFDVNFTSLKEATLHGVKAVNRLSRYMMALADALDNGNSGIQFSVPENLKDDAETGIRAMLNDPDICTGTFKGFCKLLFLLKLAPLAKKLT